jgi:hypothetical protein
MASQSPTSGQALRMKLTIDGPPPLVQCRSLIYRKHFRKAHYYLLEVYSYPNHVPITHTLRGSQRELAPRAEASRREPDRRMPGRC